MRSPASLRLTYLAAWIAVGLWIPHTAPAQDAADAETTTEAPQPIALESVPDRAVAVRGELDGLLPSDASRQALERLGEEVDGRLEAVDSLLAKARDAISGAPSMEVLHGLEAELSGLRARLQPPQDELDAQLAGFGETIQRLDVIAAVWEATADAARREGAARATSSRIAGVRREVESVRAAVIKQRDAVLAVRDRLVDPSSAIAASLEQAQAASGVLLQGVFRISRPPLWSSEVRESLREEWETGGPESIWQRLEQSLQYTRERAPTLGFQLAVFAALGLFLRLLRDRARGRAEDDYDLHDAKEVFELPWAMALLIAVGVTNSVHIAAPRGLGLFVGALLAPAVLRIGLRFLVPALAPLAWGIVALFLFDRAHDLLDTMPTVFRLLSLVERTGALLLLLWLLRPRRLAEIPPELWRAPFLRRLGVALRLAAAVLALAIAADLVGWGDLANLLGNAALRSGTVGFYVFVVLKVIEGLSAFALVYWPLRLSNAISRHRGLVRRRLESGLKALAVVAWASIVLGQLGLLAAASAVVRGVFGAHVDVGALSVSLGDVTAFGVTVWLSLLLARLVNFVLLEDVFTRVRTGRGVPYAISGLIRYTLIFLGFLVGLAAAGFELSKLTVIVGGLGVGIGFGLQNVVNNFVSGLILLFERPIQVGDVVQLPDVWGAIKRIGIRASVIRTFDGAEVIVPNGMLISDRVTNWTLSDKHRRVEVDVGVVYGTPAQRVIDLLLEVAAANPSVIAEPSPRAFFMRFGDSALEFKLRVWVEFDDGYSIRSELGVAVQEALAQAGIVVPFPQRDLHLVSVSPNAAAELGTATPPIPPSGSDDPS